MDKPIHQAAKTVIAIQAALPSIESVEALAVIANRAADRGYFDPVEDDAFREVFSRYLMCRSVLMETIRELRPRRFFNRSANSPEVFIVAYAAAALLISAGKLLLERFSSEAVVVKKLDEAEPRYGIPRKQFKKIYRSYTAPKNVWVFAQACRYWHENKQELERKFEKNTALQPLIDLLNDEAVVTDVSTGDYAENLLRYRFYSFWRRNRSGLKSVSFALFKMSGRMVSDVKLPWKRKRITPRVRKKLAAILQPGDVIVTRHDDAATNIFLPGFWPHAALYIGTEYQREDLGIDLGEKALDPICTLEALKDGVRFRPLKSTLAVDACTILRPKLSSQQIADAIKKVASHEGKEYDFEFDFRRSDKLVCTEVIYRAYHGLGPIRFEPVLRAGRICLSAEDLLNHALNQSFFDVVAIYGFKGNRFAKGERAIELLRESYCG